VRRSGTAEPLVRSGTTEPLVEAGALAVVIALAVVVRTTLAHRVVVPPVVMAVMPQVGDLEAGKEDAQDDEHDAGDDPDPSRESVEPIGFDRHGRRLCGHCVRCCWGVRCFAHTRNDPGLTARFRWVQPMKNL
jgi:hypothetical protein